MRFWIVQKQETVDAIFEAIYSGECKTEAQVEAIAAQMDDTVEWAKNWDTEDMKHDGYCGRPEWADKDGCPMDNPNEEMTDCAECRWFNETEDAR